jgi:hypothetical protein
MLPYKATYKYTLSKSDFSFSYQEFFWLLLKKLFLNELLNRAIFFEAPKETVFKQAPNRAIFYWCS